MEHKKTDQRQVTEYKTQHMKFETEKQESPQNRWLSHVLYMGKPILIKY